MSYDRNSVSFGPEHTEEGAAQVASAPSPNPPKLMRTIRSSDDLSVGEASGRPAWVDAACGAAAPAAQPAEVSFDLDREAPPSLKARAASSGSPGGGGDVLEESRHPLEGHSGCNPKGRRHTKALVALVGAARPPSMRHGEVHAHRALGVVVPRHA